MPSKTLFSAMKNEAPFVLEWVAYHKAIGFDRIVIYSNDSDDGSTRLLDALATAGEIEHRLLSVPPDTGPQINAAREANRAGILHPDDWVLWLDGDEFLNIHAGDGTLDALLNAIGPREGIVLQWRIFGDSGNSRFPGRLISADFTGASLPDFAPNLELKTLFRVTPRVVGFADVGINRPLLRNLPDNRADLFVNGRGTAISESFGPNRRWLNGEDFQRSRLLAPDDAGWELAQVNHYIVRTPEHFALKKSRGRGWRPEGRQAAERHNEHFYASMNRNDAQDRTILRHASRVSAEIARMRLDQDVARAEFDALCRVNARIHDMLAAP